MRLLQNPLLLSALVRRFSMSPRLPGFVSLHGVRRRCAPNCCPLYSSPGPRYVPVDQSLALQVL